MMNYTVPGGRFDIVWHTLIFINWHEHAFCHLELVGKCNRGLMVVGSLRHLVKEREKVSGHSKAVKKHVRLSCSTAPFLFVKGQCRETS